MLFRFIERWFPDPISRDYAYNQRKAVTWQMASIAVAFPIFLAVMRTILREAQDRPERLQSGVRKWLTYIALLVTAGAMITDLIWFLNYFLSGELTSRFVLKALTVMLICGGIFVYYLSPLRWDRNTNVAQARRRSLKFGIGAAAAVAVSFAIGLGVAGSPSEQRHMEADRKRIEDLRAIASAVNAWYRQAKLNQSSVLIPSALTELVDKGMDSSRTIDPETRNPYGYDVRSSTTYELCATFSAAGEESPVTGTHFWQHGKGWNCFILDASEPPVW